MSDALARLAHNGKAAMAHLTAKFAGLMCTKSFPMLRRLFDAVVLPTVSYGCLSICMCQGSEAGGEAHDRYPACLLS